MELREKKHELVLLIFDLIKYIIDLPFSREALQLKGLESIGDLLVDIWDYDSALVYYFKGVFTFLLCRIGRCREE